MSGSMGLSDVTRARWLSSLGMLSFFCFIDYEAAFRGSQSFFATNDFFPIDLWKYRENSSERHKDGEELQRTLLIVLTISFPWMFQESSVKFPITFNLLSSYWTVSLKLCRKPDTNQSPLSYQVITITYHLGVCLLHLVPKHFCIIVVVVW